MGILVKGEITITKGFKTGILIVWIKKTQVNYGKWYREI